MNKNSLEMKHITKRFPGVIALQDVSMSVRKGEVHAICGENGAGKSTLMKILSGSYTSKEYEGEIWIDGKKQDFTSVKVAENAGIEMVYQELNVMLDSSVAENIYVGNLPMKGIFVDYDLLYRKTAEILTKLGLSLDPKQHLRGLNSGQMQLISIGRALSKQPKIVVLDEPTGALTDTETSILMDSIRQMKKEGVSFLFISHKLEEVYEIADSITVMRDGKVIFEDEIANVSEDRLIKGMIGRTIENMYPKEHNEIGNEVLRVEHLTVPHPNNRGQNIVQDVSFSLHKGEVLGIGGLVGAGRSETLSAIFGYINDNVQKKVFVEGKEVNIKSPSDAIRLGFGYVTEERKTNGYVWVLSIRENLTLASLDQITERKFIQKEKEKELAQQMFDRLEVKAPSMETMVVNLSGGNQQKVVVGKWLLSQPRILFIDEPTKGIDVGTKSEIYKMINELTRSGVSIVMVSSDMPELVSMSDRCLVLSNGRVTAELEGEDITQENIMRAAIA